MDIDLFAVAFCTHGLIVIFVALNVGTCFRAIFKYVILEYQNNQQYIRIQLVPIKYINALYLAISKRLG